MNIELYDIHKVFGRVEANRGVSLTIRGGTIHGLLGENGAGKTTLMKILSGYQSCDSGRIVLDGREVRLTSPADAIAQRIGMLHQDPLDIPALSALDNFMLGRKGGLFTRQRQARRELQTLCDRFRFDLDPDEPVSGLTVGERQQLELVRLLSLGVRTIILDEPTTGISAPQKALLFATLRELAEGSMSVIFVSHKLDEVQDLCARVTVLRQGAVAGAAEAPFTNDQLVEMMFGRCLARASRTPGVLGDPVLSLAHLSARNHRLEVRDLSLEVRRGEVIGLAGLEGSGQQILLQACAGILPARSGSLKLAGREMRGQPYRRFTESGVAYVPAARLEEGLVADLSLREHVALTSKQRGFFVRWDEATDLATERIRQFNIVGQPGTLVQELSGGNQQRAILSLLPQTLELLLLEHPTRGLDIESSAAIWQRLLRRRSEGTAILFTSTDLDELLLHSDRILVFSGGTMAAPVSAEAITCDELGHLIGGRIR